MICDLSGPTCGGLLWTEPGAGSGITHNGYICRGAFQLCIPTFGTSGAGGNGAQGSNGAPSQGTQANSSLAELLGPKERSTTMTVDGTDYSVHAVELEPGLMRVTGRRLRSEVSTGEILSTTMDFVPVAGSLKAVLQLITGRDAVTGERLSRFGELIGIGLGILPGGRGAQKLPKIIRVAERLELRHSNVLSTREIAHRLEGRVAKGAGKLLPLRQAYVDEVAELANKAAQMRKAGLSSEDIARALHAERRNLGVKYKELTPRYKRLEIYTRNIQKYGDKLGPSIDYLRNVKGKSWDQIRKRIS